MSNGDHRSAAGAHGTNGCSWPDNVGIIAMEVYFPNLYVDQTELEVADGVSSGKYTIGLGQANMGFCSDLEDINSLCLTVVQRLMTRNGINYNRVGRLEVGTETIVDKSKSVKSVLMQLFEESGNSDVEGVDSTNACYGGTAALFNSVAWIESSAWDGRLAVAVSADIAVYASGSARPTGGAGAVALLLAPNAPLILERGVRGSHFEHAYDFYKPDLSSEFPVVDGPLSVRCYIGALDKCYRRYRDKCEGRFSLDDADMACFHSPYCKLVQKSLARLVYNDSLDATPDQRYAALAPFRELSPEKAVVNKDLERATVACSQQEFASKTEASLLLSRHIGNMYTASLYGCLAAAVGSSTSSELAGKRVLMFSYGSGLTSTMFSLKFTDNGQDKELEKLCGSLDDLKERLEARKKVSPQDFTNMMEVRERTHHLAPYDPVGAVSDLAPETWYLASVDAKHRRHYQLAPSQPAQVMNSNGMLDERATEGVHNVIPLKGEVSAAAAISGTAKGVA